MDKTLGGPIDERLKKNEAMASFKIMYQKNRETKSKHYKFKQKLK